jgi:hypothetical protein
MIPSAPRVRTSGAGAPFRVPPPHYDRRMEASRPSEPESRRDPPPGRSEKGAARAAAADQRDAQDEQREVDFQRRLTEADLDADRRDQVLGLRERLADRREQQLHDRETAADQRDEVAARRDDDASERARLADLRDAAADQREIDSELLGQPPTDSAPDDDSGPGTQRRGRPAGR